MHQVIRMLCFTSPPPPPPLTQDEVVEMFTIMKSILEIKHHARFMRDSKERAKKTSAYADRRDYFFLYT